MKYLLIILNNRERYNKFLKFFKNAIVKTIIFFISAGLTNFNILILLNRKLINLITLFYLSKIYIIFLIANSNIEFEALLNVIFKNRIIKV